MRNARSILLLALTALVAMAMAAPTTFGQAENHETLEVANETTGEHCPAVTPTSGGCLLHATSNGEVELRRHVFGVEQHLASCENEFWGRVNEDGEGWLVHQKLLEHPDGKCKRAPCGSASGTPSPWPAHGDEAHNGVDGEGPLPWEGTEKMEVVFCVEPKLDGGGHGSPESCEIEIPFNADHEPTVHEYEFGHATEVPGHGVSGFRCELVGHWRTEHIAGRLENSPTGQLENTVTVTHIPFENKAELP
jgi:hypothetical protein